MALFLVGLLQQVTVELLDMILGQINRVIMREDRLHRGGVACDLLLVTAGKGRDIDL